MASRNDALLQRRCAHCGDDRFMGRRARFCSDACRMRAFRRRAQGLPESFTTIDPSGSYSLRDVATSHSRSWLRRRLNV
jgi:hypothetical protein